MYALSFDMVVSDLKQYYGEPYGKATFLEFTDILAEGVTRYMESTRNTSYSHTRCVTAQ